MTYGVIFDMDGTLFDTGDGIKSCIKYAIKTLGKPALSEEQLSLFIGPSLFDSFENVAGLDPETAKKAVELYRSVYENECVNISRPYEGTEDMLKKLYRRGYILTVATSKPLVMVDKLLVHYGLKKYFKQIVAPDYARIKSEKKQLVLNAMLADRSVMVGDTYFDINGAHEAGIKVIAVNFGYGAPETLLEADAFASSPQEVYELITRLGDGLFLKNNQ